MGIDPKLLKDRQVDMIGDPAQRREVVKRRGFDTTAKNAAKQEYKLEEALHNDFISWLNRHELAYVHAAMKKRSTIQKGCPDFTVTAGERYGYRSLYIEFKLPGKKLSPEQESYIAELQRKGCKVLICYDYETATRETAAFLGLAVHQG